MTTLKVLNVVLDNEIGGPQIRVLSVAKKLRKYGIETVMLSPKGRGDFAQRARNEHFKVYQIRLYGPKHFNSFVSILANIRWFFTFPFSTFMIAKIIRKEKIDIVHTNGLLNLQAPVAGLLTRRKIVWHLISSLYPKILVSFLMPFITLIADQIVVVAEKLGGYYLGSKLKLLSDINASIIYECVDLNKFNPSFISENEIVKLKKGFNISPFEKIVGCIGGISHVKGYEYFVQSASLVRKELDNVRFMIVGAVSDSQQYYHLKLQTLISSLGLEQSVILTGKRDDIPQVLSMFDVFVLPSIAEGTPLVILEAMAMEKPVVATDVGAVSEQILDGETGIIVPPKDPEALAEAVIYLLRHPEQGSKMGKEGRKRIKEMFSLDRCVEEHKRLYDSV